MDTLTKNFLKFIANNKGLLDKETLDIIVTESIIIHLKKDKYSVFSQKTMTIKEK